MSSWTTVFLVHSLKRTEKLGIYKALKFLGDVFLSHNDEQTAISLFTIALEGFTEMDVHRSRAECMLQFGDISMGHGDLLKAVEFWERAKPLFDRSSQTKQVHCINERLAGISNDVLEQHKTTWLIWQSSMHQLGMQRDWRMIYLTLKTWIRWTWGMGKRAKILNLVEFRGFMQFRVVFNIKALFRVRVLVKALALNKP
ncbi:hypothetical protein B0H13DRAFT_1928578 [Mycena leptocephala]|nr:hypothetical protein B0H13DRAFT_1928578 [Mycena leptocephala]